MTSSAAAVARTDGPSARAERPIVVGIDGSPGSVAALRWAASEARAHGRPLTAVVAYDVPAYYGYPLAPVPSSTTRSAWAAKPVWTRRWPTCTATSAHRRFGGRFSRATRPGC